MATFPKPVIAMINGYCLGGGCELSMSCDLRIASEKAKLGQPEINLGLIPGGGGTQRLPRLVGQGRALQMVLTGAPIKANDALAFGLVSQVVELDQLMGAAEELAGKLMSFSAVTLRLAEETVRQGMEMAMGEALAFEASQFGLAASTADYQEGMHAFLEKRKPTFTGR
jgi:enoyl-CoA hydratase